MSRELPALGLEALRVLVSLDSLITLHQLTAQYFHVSLLGGGGEQIAHGLGGNHSNCAAM